MSVISRAAGRPQAGGHAPQCRQAWVVGLLRAVLLGLLLALGGCASGRGGAGPAVEVSPATWAQAERDMAAASQVARGKAEDYAREAMERWMDLVYQRTDNDFIPWFTSGWTQQWMGVKVAWYKFSAGSEPAVEHLTAYMQEQYQRRVLDPVAEQIDPSAVMAAATGYYVQQLGAQLRAIPPRYGIPQAQFDERLKAIAAIDLAPPATYRASLYQLVQSDPPTRLPAYGALLARVHDAAGKGIAAPASGVSEVARRTSEKLVTEVTARSAAGAVAAAVGRVAGLVISLGATSVSAMVREHQRAEVEAQLRQNLNAAFDETWLKLMRDPDGGVLAGVWYLSTQIDQRLAADAAPPATPEVPSDGQALPLPSSDAPPDQ
ncbi:hypothetical protein [Pseudomonas panipatensis]|uniref:Lipoprotein n=1 Tax=Pseudomonas panipatensis TaxID=428992 RepID=A0A1G8L3Y4_9PSED|nr:hypothetical protein [Pseudomonas panipatensis]SDI50416.1 hypothetical protein SAMN05216272_110138 [Pseudomonas panipatensis]SMP72534.1 hypothetical protein SAMN06295951_11132 [Pseudomonas panipatensis]